MNLRAILPPASEVVRKLLQHWEQLSWYRHTASITARLQPYMCYLPMSEETFDASEQPHCDSAHPLIVWQEADLVIGEQRATARARPAMNMDLRILCPELVPSSAVVMPPPLITRE